RVLVAERRSNVRVREKIIALDLRMGRRKDDGAASGANDPEERGDESGAGRAVDGDALAGRKTKRRSDRSGAPVDRREGMRAGGVDHGDAIGRSDCIPK